MAKIIQGNQVVTNEVRFSHPHFFVPYANDPTQPGKYSGTFLLPKSDTETYQLLMQVIEAQKALAAQSKWNGVVPPIVPTPIHDGDGVKQDGTPFPDESKGHWVFSASAKADYKPEVVNAQRVPITNQTEIYAGCYGQVCINVFAYSYQGKKGIGFGLGPIMKTRDGEPLGGGSTSAASAFGAPEGGAASVFAQPAPQPVPGFVNAPPAVDPITGQPITPPWN